MRYEKENHNYKSDYVPNEDMEVFGSVYCTVFPADEYWFCSSSSFRNRILG